MPMTLSMPLRTRSPPVCDSFSILTAYRAMDSHSPAGANLNHLVASQIHELDMLRAKFYALEQTHHQVKQK